MKSFITQVILLLLISHAAFSQKATGNKPVYKWYPAESQSLFPAVLVLGGSEGGLNYGEQWAKVLAKQGYGVMALAYFNEANLPGQLEEIPLEYFQSALDTLKTFKGVKSSNISIISVSKGTEAALLLASQDPSIRLVVAASPSHAVWQSVNREGYKTAKSSWTKNGQPLPFLAYDYSRGYYPIINFYLGALEKPVNEQTIINVEKSSADFLLFSGGQDKFWPATTMAEKIKERLDQNHYAHQSQIINFKEAGHGFLIPYQNEEDKKKVLAQMSKMMAHFGGTIEAFDEAMTQSQKIVLDQLKKTNSEK